jgi:serine/threonine-protein kinase HipA
VKNLSFHMDAAGEWTLTPAYDLTFAKGGGWTATHQMRIADRRSGITRGDLIAVAGTFGIRNPAGMIAQVADAVGRWPEFARECSVPSATVADVAKELAARAAELKGSV